MNVAIELSKPESSFLSSRNGDGGLPSPARFVAHHSLVSTSNRSSLNNNLSESNLLSSQVNTQTPPLILTNENNTLVSASLRSALSSPVLDRFVLCRKTYGVS